MKNTDTHPKAAQLYRNILRFADERTAREIAFGLPLAPGASADQRAARRCLAAAEFKRLEALQNSHRPCCRNAPAARNVNGAAPAR